MQLSRGENLSVVDSSGTTHQVITSTGLCYSQSTPVGYSETGSTATNLKPYGVSLLARSTGAGTMKKYTLDAPISGIAKELILGSTLGPMGSSDATQVVISGAEVISYNSTALDKNYTNIAMQTPHTYVKLIGLSTTKWGLADFQSASTNATYTGLAGLSSGLSTGITST